jgi:tetratricopeptide (TPR) repeat protein
MLAAVTAHKRSNVARLLFLLLLLAATPALAQSSDEVKQCARLTQAGGDAKERIDVCTRAVESPGLSQEDLAGATNNRGLAYVAAGDLDRAIADFDKSLALQPGYINALMDRGMAYGTKGDQDRAVADFSDAIGQDPRNADAYNGRCYSLALGGKAAAALDDCNRALALQPNTPYILDSRAYAFLRAGDFPRALADYDLILQLEPKNAPALYGRGLARLRLGRQQAGQQDLAAARAADAGIDAAMAKIGLAP